MNRFAETNMSKFKTSENISWCLLAKKANTLYSDDILYGKYEAKLS